MINAGQWSAAWSAAITADNTNLLPKLLSRIELIAPGGGYDAIKMTVETGHQELAMTLLMSNAVVLKLSPVEVATVLETAMERRCRTVVQALLERDVDFDPDRRPLFDQRRNLLHIAVEWGDTAIVENLLSAGARFSSNSTVMYTAVRRRSRRMVDILFQANGISNWSRFSWHTPLSAAARNRDVSMAAHLLSLGADPRDSKALEIASSVQREWYAADLTGIPEDDDRLQNPNGDKPLHTILPIHMAMVHLLIGHFKKRYPEGDSDYGSEALKSAIQHNRPEVYDYLMDSKIGLSLPRGRFSIARSHTYNNT